MGVPVMQVRIMRMPVPQRRVAVHMRMWFNNFTFMHVPVMLIMDMAMVMNELGMDMLVFMAFGQMQPQANCHQCAGDNELRGHGLLQEHDGQHRADEWRQGEIGPGPRRAQMAQAKHEHHKAYANAKKAHK